MKSVIQKIEVKKMGKLAGHWSENMKLILTLSPRIRIQRNWKCAQNPICKRSEMEWKRVKYQPMPSAKAHGFLDNALQSNEYGFGSIISSNDDFGMARKDGELLLATIPAALQVRETAAMDRTLHSVNHFGVYQMKWRGKAMQWCGKFEGRRRKKHRESKERRKRGRGKGGILLFEWVVVLLWIPTTRQRQMRNWHVREREKFP